MNLSNAVLAAMLVAGVGFMTSLALVPSSALPSEVITVDEGLVAGHQPVIISGMDCHNGAAHSGSEIGLDYWQCYCRNNSYVCYQCTLTHCVIPPGG